MNEQPGRNRISVLDRVRSLLRGGMSAQQIALTLALGIAISVSPLIGLPTLLCTIVAVRFRLNLPLIQTVNYSFAPLQWILLIPFLRMGEFILGANPLPLAPSAWLANLKASPWQTIGEFPMALLYAGFAWILIAPLAAVALYWGARTVLSAVTVRSSASPARVAKVMLVLLLGGVPCSYGDQAERFPTPFRHEATQTELQLNGYGTLRFAGLLKIYDAALYLPPNTPPSDALGDIAKRFEVEYATHVKAKHLVDSTYDILARQFKPEELAPLKEDLVLIGSWWEDGEKGDRVALTYVPSYGTELTINGRSKGIVQGADFARVYFSLWLGPDPASGSLKKKLLGG